MIYTSDIKIKFVLASGLKLRANAVVDCHIKKSIYSLVNTAVIALPITSRLEKKTETLPSEDTAKIFNAGDRVEIQMGHNNELVTEFKGFVDWVNLKDPCQIECEGYSYQLRRKAPVKGWKTVKLKEVLELLTEGTDITIHPDTPDTTISPFYLGKTYGETALQALERIKEECNVNGSPLVAYFINDTELYVGPEQFAQTDKRVVHNLARNVIADSDDLKWRRKEDSKVQVTVIWKDAKGKTHTTKVGDAGGVEKVKRDTRISTKEQAETFGLKIAEFERYEGYEGKIRTLLVPYCAPGYTSVLRDTDYPEVNQVCIIEATEVRYMPGNVDERIVEIGRKINR